MTILDEIAVYTSKRMAVEEERVSTASLRRQALAMASAGTRGEWRSVPISVQRRAGKAGPFVYLRS